MEGPLYSHCKYPPGPLAPWPLAPWPPGPLAPWPLAPGPLAPSTQPTYQRSKTRRRPKLISGEEREGVGGLANQQKNKNS